VSEENKAERFGDTLRSIYVVTTMSWPEDGNVQSRWSLCLPRLVDLYIEGQEDSSISGAEIPDDLKRHIVAFPEVLFGGPESTALEAYDEDVNAFDQAFLSAIHCDSCRRPICFLCKILLLGVRALAVGNREFAVGVVRDVLEIVADSDLP
jgi:hypothetical protein